MGNLKATMTTKEFVIEDTDCEITIIYKNKFT